jgi:hypothetical protein
MQTNETQKFLSKLQAQAELQARLNTHRFFPSQMDEITSFIGRYPWQVVLVASGLTSLWIEVLTRA